MVCSHRGGPEDWTDAEHERNRYRKEYLAALDAQADVDALAGPGSHQRRHFCGLCGPRPGVAGGRPAPAGHAPPPPQPALPPLKTPRPWPPGMHRLKRNRDPLLKPVLKATLMEAYALAQQDAEAAQCIARSAKACHASSQPGPPKDMSYHLRRPARPGRRQRTPVEHTGDGTAPVSLVDRWFSPPCFHDRWGSRPPPPLHVPETAARRDLCCRIAPAGPAACAPLLGRGQYQVPALIAGGLPCHQRRRSRPPLHSEGHWTVGALARLRRTTRPDGADQ
eukprot:jgi/Mesvir1/2101/Mv25636-RA.1